MRVLGGMKLCCAKLRKDKPRNPNLSEVSYTPSPDLFQSLPRDQSYPIQRGTHTSPSFHHPTTPSPHPFYFTTSGPNHYRTDSTHRHSTGPAYQNTSSSYQNTSSTYQNTSSGHLSDLSTYQNNSESSQNITETRHHLECMSNILSDVAQEGESPEDASRHGIFNQKAHPHASFNHTSNHHTVNPGLYHGNFNHISHQDTSNHLFQESYKDILNQSNHSPILSQISITRTQQTHQNKENVSKPREFREEAESSRPSEVLLREAERGLGEASLQHTERRRPGELSLRERLALTQSVWLQPQMTRVVAVQKLHTEEPGVFVIRHSSRAHCVALSVRVGLRPRIEHYLIEESAESVKLENSYHSFSDLLHLVLYYATQLDELPEQLTLPTSLMDADRTTLLLCQTGFWSNSQLSENGGCVPQSTSNMTTVPVSSSSTGVGSMIFTHKTYTQHTEVTHTQQTHSQHLRKIATEPLLPLSSMQDIKEPALEFQRDSRRLSLSQINHSHKSPFSCPESTLVKTDSLSSQHSNSGSFTKDTSILHNYFGICDNHSYPEKEKNYFKPISDILDESNDGCKVDSESAKLVELNEPHKDSVISDLISDTEPGAETSVKVTVEEHSVEDIVRNYEKEVESLVDQQTLRNSSTTALGKLQPSYSNIAVSSDGLHKLNSFPDLKPSSTAPPVMIDHSFPDLPPLKPAETAPAVISTQYSSHSMLNPPLGTKNEPVVFRFDFSSESNAGLNSLMAPPCDSDPPLSAKTQYSSPAYAEPFDTLIGHVQGVSQTQGAIHVNDFIRQKMQTTIQQRQHMDHSKKTVEKKASSSRTHSNSKRINLCKTSNVKPAGALDSSLTANPHYKVSLEEIPLSPGPGSLQRSHRQSPSQRFINADHNTPVQSSRFEKPDCITVNHLKPPHFASHSHAKRHHKTLPLHMANNIRQPPKVQRQNSGCSQFPVNNGGSSDCSTAEDVLSKLCPEMIFTPIKSLTQKNVHRISDYDNCGSSFNHRHLGSVRPVSSHRSGGTHYSQPWDSSLWKQLLAYKHSSQLNHPTAGIATMEGDQASFCNDSDAQSMLGSDVACSTFEWRKKTKQVVATETQTKLDSGEDGDEECYEFSEDESMGKGQGLVEELLQSPVTPVSPWTPNNDFTPGGKVENYVSGLAEKAETMFGSHVDRFVNCTVEGLESNPHIVLRNVRQFMNGIKNYLVKHGEQELHQIIEIQRNRLEQNEFLNMDSIIESSLHKSVIKPLKKHMYTLLVTHYKEKGHLQQMADNIQFARSKTPQDLGIKSWLLPPSGETMESIHSALHQMQKEYSPLRKLHQLLDAMHILLNSLNFPDHVSTDSGDTTRSAPAEDLLPVLVYVLVQCGLVTAEVEAEYMWGLLHPCVLAGEAGYYLTTLSSAVELLKNIGVAMETHSRQGLRYIGELQGFLKVLIPDETCNNIITRTFPVRPTMTSRDVCAMIAHRFNVTNPQNYSLHILVKGREERVSEMDFPHQIKARHTHRNLGCLFAFKRNNATFAWPIHLK